MESVTAYIFPMRKKEHEWEVIRLQSKGEYMGRVSAADNSQQSILAPTSTCAVQRRDLSVGDRPTRQLSLQPVAIGAVV